MNSTLPFGRELPVGDEALWNLCLAQSHGDVMQTYADVRGLTREQAKRETFIIRYGGWKSVKNNLVSFDHA